MPLKTAMRYARLLLIAGALASPLAHATVNDAQLWEALIVQPRLGSGFGSYIEIQPRFGDGMGSIHQLIVRPALNYEFAPGWTAWLGYHWQANYTPKRMSENRSWEQVQYAWKGAPGWELYNRGRLEQRFLPDVDLAWRLRYQLRALRQIGESRWYALLSDEFFLNLNSITRGPQAGFDQNRLLGGVNVKLGDSVRMDAGYMFNYVNRPAPAEDRINHNLVLTLYWNP